MSNPPPTSGDFAQRLRFAREMRGHSQAELAERTGLQPSAVSHFESGRRAPSFDSLKLLADALEVTTDFLLGRVLTPGLSSNSIQQMFRHAENLSDTDLNILGTVAEALAKKRKP